MKNIEPLWERKFFYLALIWTLVIAFLSLQSISEPKGFIPIPNKDKIIHFMFYFLFVWFWVKAINYSNKAIVIVMLCAVFYGIIIEVLQKCLTTTRQGDFYDVLANTFGALCSFVFLKFRNKF